MLLPMALLGPIILPEGAAGTPRWAHCISRCCCWLLCLGPSDFWEALLMHSNGPIALADAATNYFDLAYYFLEGTADALRWAHCIGDAAADYFAWAHQISRRHC